MVYFTAHLNAASIDCSNNLQTPNHIPVVKDPDSKAITHDKPFSWFRTTIEIEKKQIHNWATLSQG